MNVLKKIFLRKQLVVRYAKVGVILACLPAFLVCLRTTCFGQVSIKNEHLETLAEHQQRNGSLEAEITSEEQKCIDTPWIDYPALVHRYAPLNHPDYSLPKGLKMLQVGNKIIVEVIANTYLMACNPWTKCEG